MSSHTLRPRRGDRLVQLVRRAGGGLAYRPDRAPLRSGEMLIGRDLTPAEAIAFILESNGAWPTPPSRRP